MSSNDSHLSKPSDKMPKGPIPQHQRIAMGVKAADGTKNPFGAPAPTNHRVGNAKVTY